MENRISEDAVAAAVSSSGTAVPSRGARLGVWVMLFVVAVHSAAIAFWVGPDNLIRRDLGFERLRSYVLPLFDQNWSVFAPEADFGNELFAIRATVRAGDGASVQTKWVPVTTAEIVPAVRHHPFPSRTVAITNRLASEHVKVWGPLSPSQQAAVGASAADTTLAGLRQKLAGLATSDGERAAASNYLKVETAIEYFLTGIARGIWGDQLVSFQIFRSQLLVPNYESWKGARQIISGETFTSNWRPPVALSSEDLPVFRAYVAKFKIR